jgi:hypothetical protein
LSNDKGVISFNSIISWEEIQALLSDAYCTLDNLRDIWISATCSLTSPADMSAFFIINRSLDDLVGEGEGDADDIDELSSTLRLTAVATDSAELSDLTRVPVMLSAGSLNDDGNEEDIETEFEYSPDRIDPWSPSFEPTTAFEADFLEYIRDYFSSYCNEQGLLSYEVFSSWDDITQMMKAGQVIMWQ